MKDFIDMRANAERDRYNALRTSRLNFKSDHIIFTLYEIINKFFDVETYTLALVV